MNLLQILMGKKAPAEPASAELATAMDSVRDARAAA